MPPEPPRSVEPAEEVEAEWEAEALINQLSGLELKAGDAHNRAIALKEHLKAAIRNRPAPCPAGRATRPSPRQAAEIAIRAQARIGVEIVEITRVSRGANVSVPGHPTIHVSDSLADILDELVKDDGPSAQGKVAWKTIAELARSLKKRGKGDVTPEAIRERIYRLRQIMKAEGLNYHFIESDDEFGYRFARRSTRRGALGGVKDFAETRIE